MATTIYLPSSGTPPLPSLGLTGGWNARTTELIRLPCSTTKSNTALTDFQYTWWTTDSTYWCWNQYQSPPLAANTTFTLNVTTFSSVVRCLEESTSADTYRARTVVVVSGDGTVVRGVIKDVAVTGNEFSTSAKTRRAGAIYAAATVNALAGDRLIIEKGVYGLTPGSKYALMRFGDPSATGDFAFEEDLTTDLCPWIQFSNTFSFAAETVAAWVPKVIMVS